MITYPQRIGQQRVGWIQRRVSVLLQFSLLNFLIILETKKINKI
jgi:hypothetical protein